MVTPMVTSCAAALVASDIASIKGMKCFCCTVLPWLGECGFGGEGGREGVINHRETPDPTPLPTGAGADRACRAAVVRSHRNTPRAPLRRSRAQHRAQDVPAAIRPKTPPESEASSAAKGRSAKLPHAPVVQHEQRIISLQD